MLICSNCIRVNEQATELMFAEADACSSSEHLLGGFTRSAALKARHLSQAKADTIYIRVYIRLVTGYVRIQMYA